jgi:lipid-A-disaccharide synthase
MDWLSAPDRVDALQTRFQQLHLALQRNTAQLSTHALEKVLSR